VAFNRTMVPRYRICLEQRRFSPAKSTCGCHGRHVGGEAASAGLLNPEPGAGIRRVNGVRRIGRAPLTPEQRRQLLERVAAAEPRCWL